MVVRRARAGSGPWSQAGLMDVGRTGRRRGLIDSRGRQAGRPAPGGPGTAWHGPGRARCPAAPRLIVALLR